MLGTPYHILSKLITCLVISSPKKSNILLGFCCFFFCSVGTPKKVKKYITIFAEIEDRNREARVLV